MSDKNGWSEYQKLVLAELNRLDTSLTVLDTKVDDIREDDLANIKSEIKLLKYKASLAGLLAGSIPVVILAIVKLFAS